MKGEYETRMNEERKEGSKRNITQILFTANIRDETQKKEEYETRVERTEVREAQHILSLISPGITTNIISGVIIYT